MKAIYNENFYKNRHKNTLYSAQKIISIVYSIIPQQKITSALDFGCGIGTWLSVVKNKNCKITGIDGSWVPKQYLVIPQQNFLSIDISQSLNETSSELQLLSKHDFSISLEVAEHINQNLSDKFIEFLTEKSDYILFSAAIPGQTGDGHVNEQWPSYWAEKFDYYGFELFDVIRHEIWDDEQIPFWYRQNCFLGARKGLLNLPPEKRVRGKKFDIVHPRQFEFTYQIDTPQPFLKRLKAKFLG